jgi:hypothetical protein
MHTYPTRILCLWHAFTTATHWRCTHLITCTRTTAPAPTPVHTHLLDSLHPAARAKNSRHTCTAPPGTLNSKMTHWKKSQTTLFSLPRFVPCRRLATQVQALELASPTKAYRGKRSRQEEGETRDETPATPTRPAKRTKLSPKTPRDPGAPASLSACTRCLGRHL